MSDSTIDILGEFVREFHRCAVDKKLVDAFISTLNPSQARAFISYIDWNIENLEKIYKQGAKVALWAFISGAAIANAIWSVAYAIIFGGA